MKGAWYSPSRETEGRPRLFHIQLNKIRPHNRTRRCIDRRQDTSVLTLAHERVIVQLKNKETARPRTTAANLRHKHMKDAADQRVRGHGENTPKAHVQKLSRKAVSASRLGKESNPPRSPSSAWTQQCHPASREAGPPHDPRPPPGGVNGETHTRTHTLSQRL